MSTPKKKVKKLDSKHKVDLIVDEEPIVKVLDDDPDPWEEEVVEGYTLKEYASAVEHEGRS